MKTWTWRGIRICLIVVLGAVFVASKSRILDQGLMIAAGLVLWVPVLASMARNFRLGWNEPRR